MFPFYVDKKFNFVCTALFWMFFCPCRFTSFYFVCFSIMNQHKLWYQISTKQNIPPQSLGRSKERTPRVLLAPGFQASPFSCACPKGSSGLRHSGSLTFCVLLFIFFIYVVHTISFQTFFVWAFKIVLDSWNFSMLLLYILWDDWPIFMISASNEQLQQELEYTLLKPDYHCWWISKMQYDTLEERYAIQFCFKLGKNATETYGMLQTAFRPSCMNRASVFEWHKRFKDFIFSRLQKKIIRTFKILGLRIEISSNLIVNFLDVTFDLNNNSLKPFNKNNDIPTNSNVNSNHPRSIIKQIPNAINLRINRLLLKEFLNITKGFINSGFNRELELSDINETNTYEDNNTPHNYRKSDISNYNNNIRNDNYKEKK